MPDKQSKQVHEAVTKAVDSADFLLRDLQDINRDGGALLSILVLPEIEKVAVIRSRLNELKSALEQQS